MAADETATDAATHTLTPDTSETIELTGPGRYVELVHHGDVDSVVWYKIGYTDAEVDTMAGGGDDNEYPLLPGERLTQSMGRRIDGTRWIGLRCAQAATVSVLNIPTSH